ncbi:MULTISPECIES: ABC transporter substrate-binding protein [unclassified Bradyrhizobium]|uniref:ABC transporter substrate-binding protein n=1 Tax=unclassified Bradyrhizobium TaxID=2631580 RepID=UPI0028EA92D4|nr:MULTISPECIES: ABC transporter substrate-binding protein [unclassified Bradyrhizobium]
MRHLGRLSGVALAASLWGFHAHAENTVYIPDVVELSGPGAVSGTNWRDGVALAVDEINAAGGILGRKITTEHLDTQSNPGVSRAQVQKVLDREPYVVLGPIYSGSVKVNMALTQQAEVPQIVGAEAADITTQGNPWIFRTAFGQQFSMPKIANYLHDQSKVKSVAVVWVNNDFGKGGRDSFVKEMKTRGIDVVSDISTEQGQVDFGSDVIKLKNVKADAIFVYTNEEESARFLIEAKRQGLSVPLFGETTLLSQKVVELAGPAANGVRGHVGLSADAPVPAIQAFAKKFNERYRYWPDHNGIKGYTAVYLVKYVTEMIGKFDGHAFGATMKGLTLTPDKAPGMLMEASWDQNGDIDRESFLAEIVDGKQKIVATLPKLKPSKAP